MTLSTVRRHGSTATKPPKRLARTPESRDFLWQALRQLRTATARELAAVTERPKNSVQVDLRYLVRTGYVRVQGADRNATYTLIRDTGVQPPLFVGRRNEILCAVDRNTHEHFGLDGNPPPAPEQLPPLRRWLPKGKPPKRSKRRSGPPRRTCAPHMVGIGRRRAAKRDE
jgi:hypothetical protein